MKRFLKWFFVILGSLVLLLLILGVTLFVRGQLKINDIYSIAAHTIEVSPADSAVLARGFHLATISACTVCHGKGLEGSVVVDDAAFGTISAPNLTTGRGGIGGAYDASDWEKAIRHGVAKDGRAILVMASNDYAIYSDDDLSALITYVTSLPPVDNTVPERNLGPIAKLLIGSGQYVPPALVIDHNAVHAPAPEAGPTVAYGKYLVRIAHCTDCHGQDLKGLEIPGPPPGPDLTGSGNVGQWQESDFFKAMRTGIKPDESVLDPEQMPWPTLSTLTDTELHAIWAFLDTL